MSLSMNTRIPLTEFNQILQTNSSPETIVALLNERETCYFKERNGWHLNRKYAYPYWKMCKDCKQPFTCHNPTQVSRNHLCKKCVTARIRRPRGSTPPEERDGMVLCVCPICKEEFHRARSRVERNEVNLCGPDCVARWRAQNPKRLKHLREIAHLGHDGWTEESRKSYLENMSGPNNPAWKGGVTYFRKKGNYGRFKIKYVRCPEEFKPMARKDGYIMEHRLIVARRLGCCLKRSEVVHHKDHNPENNDEYNLMLFASNSQHKKYEATGSPEPLWQL